MVGVKSPSLSYPVVIKAEIKTTTPWRTILELLFKKKGLIPTLQQLLIYHSKVTVRSSYLLLDQIIRIC